MVLRGKWLLAVLGLWSVAQAQDVTALSAGFSLPSGRLQCEYDEASIRCDVEGATFKAAQPAGCPLVWGDSVRLNATGRAFLVCHGDTVMDSRRPVLAYGQVWRQAGLTCRSSTAGVRCLNRDGHGFELARARYRLF